MPLIIQKYGGTSVGDVEKIKDVARRIKSAQQDGNDVVVVVSAMGGETDRLLNLTTHITDQPDEREQDALVATGEQVSTSLLAIALKSLGVNAKSFLAHQVKIQTDSGFGKARILKIDSEGISRELKEGKLKFSNDIDELKRHLEE